MPNELAVQMKSDAVLDRFTAVTGGEHKAQVFVASVLLAVKDNKALESCTSTSIIKSALRAATLRLSVDPALKQAYLVPYGQNATLQPGWKGLYDMAMRTGKYRFINVAEIKKGYTIVTDPISGFAKMDFDDNGEGGWVASFELAQQWGGMSKSFYMTHSEIQAHKEKYAKGHNRKDSAWNTSLPQMERKTVLRNLLQTWGVFDDNDQAVLAEIEAEITDPDLVILEELETMTADEMIAADTGETKNTEEETLAELGFGGKKEKDYSRPRSANIVKKDVIAMINKYFDQGAIVGENDYKILAAALTTTLGDKTKRYELCQWLIGVANTKDMSPAQIKALLVWQGITGFGEMPSDDVLTETRSCHTQALKDAGQLELT